MEEALYIKSRESTTALREMLFAINQTPDTDANTEVQTEQLLYKIYFPIIWKPLTCSNAFVRINAVELFCSIYYLTAPQGHKVDQDCLHEKQFQLLISLLTDEDHRVRCAAIHGTYSILRFKWTDVTESEREELLRVLVADLVMDASSADVRAAVVIGAGTLLLNPICHETLPVVVEDLRHCLDDKAEKVGGGRGMRSIDMQYVNSCILKSPYLNRFRASLCTVCGVCQVRLSYLRLLLQVWKLEYNTLL